MGPFLLPDLPTYCAQHQTFACSVPAAVVGAGKRNALARSSSYPAAALRLA